MEYTVSIDPEDGFEETLTVSIVAGAANDIAGNASQASISYEVVVDQTAPTVTVTGPAGPLGPAPLNLTITFSESVSGFEAEAIAVVGGSATVDGSGMDYTAVYHARRRVSGYVGGLHWRRCRAGFRRQHELRLQRLFG